MSNIFSLKSILNESNMNNNIIRIQKSENYLNSSLNILSEMNNNINNLSINLYKNVLESTSRSEENEKFGEYFKEYKKIISTFKFKMEELISKFSINVETLIDANKNIIDKAENCNLKNTSIKVYKYTNLSNDKCPSIDPYKIFKKEFVFIGKMMQDLGSAITDDHAKAKVLATVCNNLNKDIEDGWLIKCMQDISGCEDCNKDDFANIMYKKFIPNDKQDIEITLGDIQQARLSLLNYSSLIDNIKKATNDFCDGLDLIANEIGSMFFRNQDKEMNIKTNVDGIADRSYKMTDYSFNQFNIFMETKSKQITEMCNLYLIAISIKADCIFKYLQQCKDIIETGLNGVDNDPNIEGYPGDDNFEDDIDNSDLDNIDFDDNTHDVQIIENEDKDKSNKIESDFEESAYLFEATEFSINRLIMHEYTNDYFKLLINEADLNNIKSLADKASSNKIDSVIFQISKLFEKFQKVFQDIFIKRINDIKSNEKIIKSSQIPNGWTMDYIDTDKLLNISAKDFNYNSDKNKLIDEDTYLKSEWGEYLGEGKSIQDKINNKLQTISAPYNNTLRDNGLKFLYSYESEMKKLMNEINIIKNAKSKAKSIINQLSESTTIDDNISTLEEAISIYFNEENSFGDGSSNNNTSNQNNMTNTSQSQNNTNNTNNNDSKKAIDLYFSVNTKILAAKMSLMQKAAKNHCTFLEKLISLNSQNK